MIIFWTYEGHMSHLALATVGIIFASSSPILYIIHHNTFDVHFAYTTSSGSTLQFLNYRIIQSEFGTLVDQYNHIRQTLLRTFFPSDTPALFQLSPYPLNPEIEMSLYKAAKITEGKHEAIAENSVAHTIVGHALSFIWGKRTTMT